MSVAKHAKNVPFEVALIECERARFQASSLCGEPAPREGAQGLFSTCRRQCELASSNPRTDRLCDPVGGRAVANLLGLSPTVVFHEHPPGAVVISNLCTHETSLQSIHHVVHDLIE